MVMVVPYLRLLCICMVPGARHPGRGETFWWKFSPPFSEHKTSTFTEEFVLEETQEDLFPLTKMCYTLE
jgi:hypothetical protein